MSNFAIMRHDKLKSLGSIVGSAQHTFRERETLNANATVTHLNEHIGATSSLELITRVKSMLPDKRRKDAVLAIEYFIGASPEWMNQASDEQRAAFFETSRRWLQGFYGPRTSYISELSTMRARRTRSLTSCRFATEN